MKFELTNLSSDIVEQKAVEEILKCNSFTERFGLALTHRQAAILAETRRTSLKANGRMEFSGGVIETIIFEFCDSPYIDTNNYTDILNELTEIFYYFKNETMDMVSDHELIHFMKTSFDGVCHGSLDALAGRELYNLARSLVFGKDAVEENEEDKEDCDERP
ncbi:DUF6323 family protein [Sedimentibacter sp.]|uniref:DUF6323 family protein n=1 Tax=Sedimentibacter sp. TaxID=1960295 RepID=UPI00289A3061|nr:DUF6323 family protein [Sedimentibacter sp.]